MEEQKRSELSTEMGAIRIADEVVSTIACLLYTSIWQHCHK